MGKSQTMNQYGFVKILGSYYQAGAASDKLWVTFVKKKYFVFC